MRKLWGAVSVLLVLGLMCCAIPSVAGWSWAADPIFNIDGEVVSVDVEVDFADEPDASDFRKIKVELRVPDGTDATVSDAGGLKVKIKDGDLEPGKAELRVTVPGKHYLRGVIVKWVEYVEDEEVQHDIPVELQKQHDNKWVLTFDLP